MSAIPESHSDGAEGGPPRAEVPGGAQPSLPSSAGSGTVAAVPERPNTEERWARLLFRGALALIAVTIGALFAMIPGEKPSPPASGGPPLAAGTTETQEEPSSETAGPAGRVVGERVSLAGRILSFRIEEIDETRNQVRVRPLEGGPVVVELGRAARILVGANICTLTLKAITDDRARFTGDCGSAPNPPAGPPGDPQVTDDRLLPVNETVVLAAGAPPVTLSMIAPNGGALRVRFGEGALQTADSGVPLAVLAGEDLCGFIFRGLDPAGAWVALACSGEIGRRIAAENALSRDFAGNRTTRVPAGATASFLGEALDVHVGSVAADATVRISVAGGVMEAARPGWARALRVGGALCAVSLVAAAADAAEVAVACSGRIAGPGSLADAGDGASVKTNVTARARSILLGERLRIDLSMIAPDGRAVRWTLNDGRLVTTEVGRSAVVPVGAGTCSVQLIGIDGDRARVKASCDGAAAASRILIAASEDQTRAEAGGTASLLEGRLKVAVSMISPDGEAVRASVNGGGLATLPRGRPATIERGRGLCSVEYLGASDALARLRGICDRAALESDVLIAERSERVTLAQGAAADLLGGRLPVRLSLIAPDGEAVRIAVAGGPLKTVPRGETLRFASGEGRCEIGFLTRDGDEATLSAACDAAALGGRAFVPVRTESAELGFTETRDLQDGRLSLAVNMISPDRRALRVAVNDLGLKTVERGRPIELPVGRGACTLAFTAVANDRALVETACDADAFQAAPLAEGERDVVIGHGEAFRLFDRRLTVTLSMISPRGDSIRADLGGGSLKTLFRDRPVDLFVDGQSCRLVFREATSDGRARLTAGCGVGAAAADAEGNGDAKVVLGWGETVRLFGGRTELRLEMISPSRGALRVAIDGGRTRSLERGEPIRVDVGGRPCRIEYLGPEGDKAALAGRCG